MRRKKKPCPLDRQGIVPDYKDVAWMHKFVSGGFRIGAQRTTAFCRKNQALAAQAVKRARFLALIPYEERQKGE